MRDKETDSKELVTYCIMRSDLGAPVGKLIVQGARAISRCLIFAPAHERDLYLNDPLQKMIILAVPNETALSAWSEKLKSQNVKHHLITDAGLTVFQQPTRTCIGLGPMTRGQAEELGVSTLPLYK